MDDAALMAELGVIKLPKENRRRLLEYALQTLQLRISLRLAKKLTPNQLKHLEAAARRGESEGRQELVRLCPSYRDIYQQEVNKLKQDLSLL